MRRVWLWWARDMRHKVDACQGLQVSGGRHDWQGRHGRHRLLVNFAWSRLPVPAIANKGRHGQRPGWQLPCFGGQNTHGQPITSAYGGFDFVDLIIL